MVEATAPGKLLIAGEYAVLRGAPAIAVATGARARAQILPAGIGDSTLEVMPGGSAWNFAWSPGRPVEWRTVPPQGQGRILESCLAVIHDGWDPQLPGAGALRIGLDSGEFFTVAGGVPVKLGLGSSAAVTVALVAALLATCGRPARAEEVFRLALAAHRHFQGGVGSGVDVLAAAAGGVVQLAVEASAPVWQRLDWPEGLDALALWTGGSASTTGFLQRFDVFAARDPARFAAHMADLRVVAVAISHAWERSDAANILIGLAACDTALRRLDRDAGIGIFSDAHERLAELARRHGAFYKPSGAGGGDFGIAFAAGAGALDALRTAAEREGIQRFDVGGACPGVEVLQDPQRVKR